MTSLEPSSPSQPFPNLGDVITPDDVSTKGTGKYKADYINWAARCTCCICTPQAEFAKPRSCGGHVWKAPSGTGYVVGYFINAAGDYNPAFSSSDHGQSQQRDCL